MAIGRFYYLVNSYCNSSTGMNRQAVHILPQICLLNLHPNLQQRKVICLYFHVCSRSFGGRPVTVPEWRSTHSKESTTSVAKTTAFFLLCFRAYANTHVINYGIIKQFSTENYGRSSLHTFHRHEGSSSRIMGEYSRRYTRLPLKTLQQHLLAHLILTLFRTREAELVVVPVE